MTTPLPQNPFPGMNPYLERPGLWPDVHTSIIVGLRDFLGPRLRPDYGVRIQQRVSLIPRSPKSLIPTVDGDSFAYLTLWCWRVKTAPPLSEIEMTEPKPGASAVAVQLPAVELMPQRYLEVLRVDGLEVVAVIELLSPSNKSGDDRKDYLAKRAEVKSSSAHLVEIDLLRAGPPMPVIGDVPQGCYRVIVANARLRPQADLYAFGMREPVPDFVLPLGKGSEGVQIDLNQVLSAIYAHGTYEMFIDYRQDPEPPLSNADRAWLDQLLREKGLRNDGGAG